MRNLIVPLFLMFGVVACSVLPLSAAPPESWQIRPSPVDTALHSVTYGDGKFVAVGAEGRVLTSPEGSFWSLITLPDTGRMRAIAYVGGLFVAGGENGNLINISGNGVDWTNILSTTSQERIYGVTYGNGRFVAVGSRFSDGADRAWILTSTNAIDWDAVTPDGNVLKAATFGNGLFAAVGDQAAILTSPDGLQWTPRTAPLTNDQAAVTYMAHGEFLSSGMFGFSIHSGNGFDWTEASRASFSVRGLLTADGYTVGVGRSQNTGRIQMVNGFGWPGDSLVFPNLLNGVAYGNDIWVAVGEGGIIVQANGPNLEPIVEVHIEFVFDHLDLLLTGPPGNYRLEASTDFQNWETLATFNMPDPAVRAYVMRVDDPNFPHRCFRAVFLP